MGGDWRAEDGSLREAGPEGGRIIRNDVPEDLENFTFSYQSQQAVEDFDGNPATENKYGPEYYGLALMKVFQREPEPMEEKGEYAYIAIAITPNWRGQGQ